MRLLALLRDRRFPVQLLWRLAIGMSSGYGDVADHLDRHMPQSGGSTQLHRFVQRLLRKIELRPMPL